MTQFRVMVTDDVDPEGVAVLRDEPRLQVDEVPTLSVAELLERIGDYNAIVGRSATRITPEILARAERLRVIGRAGVGVDNIAIDAATALGIAVINAPAGNTIAVAELFFAAVLGFLRQIPEAATSMSSGKWARSDLMGTEMCGRTLGIIGLGRIGGEIASRAHAFGAKVLAYDPYIAPARFESLRVRRVEHLEELLRDSDIVTVHTPLTSETEGMIAAREIAQLRSGAILVNMARGGIVNEADLAEALAGNRLRGAIVDAFQKEPLASTNPLRALKNVLLTPHIGASTVEAQRNVAVDVCIAVCDLLTKDELGRSLNVPLGNPARWTEAQPAISLARLAAAVGRGILDSQGTRAISRIDVRTGSGLSESRGVIAASAAVGVLESILGDERLNLINAPSIAAARGIELTSGESLTGAGDWTVHVRLGGGMQELVVGGVAPPGTPPRLTRIGAFHLDIQPRETLIVLTNNDVPGVIGRVGTRLGEAGVNIAEYHQARLAQGGQALAAISVDGVMGAKVKESLMELPDILSVTVLDFRTA